MNRPLTRLSLLLTALLLAACASRVPPPPLQVQVLALNDFHGNLQPPAPYRPTDGSAPVAVGGAEAIATAVKTLQQGRQHSVFVAAGDLIGASPLLSALFRDEPTIESLSQMGLQLSAVGNHEFDLGAAELLRRQQGGCHPVEGCKGPTPFRGASFQYLAASTIVESSGQTLLPPYAVKRFDGIPVGFIGLTLKGTPSLVMPTGVAGLRFDDEVETVNRWVKVLKEREGVEAIVVLIHEGGYPSGGPDECPSISGPIANIVRGFDKAVDLVVTGHTHRAYNCVIDGRRVTSGDKYGSMLTEIELSIDRRSRDVIASSARNVLTRLDRFAPDPAQTALIDTYRRLAKPLTERVIGRIGAEIPVRGDELGSSPMGQLIADSQLAATRAAGAELALMNNCGVRGGLQLRADGLLRYEDLFTTQPFGNELITLSLSGAELRALLESMWSGPRAERICGRLQFSSGLEVNIAPAAPAGQRVRAVLLHGKPVTPEQQLRVTVNSFLRAGGDGFTEFAGGRDAQVGPRDIDALEAYVAAQALLQPPALDRVRAVAR